MENKVTDIKENTEMEKFLKDREGQLNEIILRLPNIPDEDVPIGENKVIIKKF